jgi:hypothetical protein
MRRLLTLFATAALLGGLMVAPVSAETITTGSWVQYPTGATEYQAEVQQPINTTNTSNWTSKSQGAIPVMFKLSSRTGPAAFESIGSDGFEGYSPGNFANDVAFMSFTPSPSITFNDISVLRTAYAFTVGDCHGGSLRWQVRTSATQALFIYYGALPNFTDCTTASQTGVNMVNQPDLRYDTSQYVAGTQYNSYAGAQAIMGNLPIMRVSLVIDSGWYNLPNGDQRLNVTDTTVNDNVYQFVSAGTFAPTCELPPATIEISQNDPVTSGAVNEAAVQASLADDGNSFRVVDCKYQYILSIPSLDKVTGTYEVQIWIGGVRVPTPTSLGGKVTFDLK